MRVLAARRGGLLVGTGFAIIIALIIWYGRYQDSALLTPQAISAIGWLANMFYVLLLACLAMIAWGMYLLHRDLAGGGGGLVYVMASATWGKRPRRIFLAVSVSYGIFFSLISGTLVYQPEVDFETAYGAQIPSAFVAPCCGDIGYMPKIIVYLTNHVGLQIVPINIILQIIVSYLVGVNAALAAIAYTASRKVRSAGAAGALTGLFVACPTCAGAASSIFLGTASGIAVSAALAQLQTLFIGISIPVLFAVPFLLGHRIRSCRV